MRLSPCRFNLPLTDNQGQPIDPEVIVALHRELMEHFGGFTIHPTNQGRWRSREGKIFQEEIVVYEIAVSEDQIPLLREMVCRLGRQLGQLAMFFDAPLPSVDIIDLSAGAPPRTAPPKGKHHGPKKGKTARHRGKRNRRSG